MITNYKAFEMYRTDRSRVFNTDTIKKLPYYDKGDRITPMSILRKYKPGVDSNFISVIKRICKEKNWDVKILPESRVEYGSRIEMSYNHTYIPITFSINQEDLSWGGISSPILINRYKIDFFILEDEYFLLGIEVISINKDGLQSGLKRIRDGHIFVDGEDNLERAMELIIENYDQIEP